MANHDLDSDQDKLRAVAPAEPESKTAVEAYAKITASNPRFKKAKNTGQAFIIVGAVKP